MGVSGTPRLLDLFCGAGGAAMGYSRAGFEVVGVDIEPQPNYPFKFVQDDALELMASWIDSCRGWWDEPPFDAIHASPPCQLWSAASGNGREKHEDLITPLRPLLEATELPYVIENVEGAPLNDPVMICGTMFDPPLGVKRHRLFETNWGLEPPAWPCRHMLAGKRFKVFEHGKWRLTGFAPVYGTGGRKAREYWHEAMGIDWMTHDELAQAIPPAYAEIIGRQLMAHVKARVAA